MTLAIHARDVHGDTKAFFMGWPYFFARQRRDKNDSVKVQGIKDVNEGRRVVASLSLPSLRRF